MSVLPPQNILLSIRRRGQGLGAGGTRVPPLPAVPTWSAADDDLVPFPLGPQQRGSQLDPVPGAAMPPVTILLQSAMPPGTGWGRRVPSGMRWLL